jgi:toxin-antitoxin system PIN domain toxin
MLYLLDSNILIYAKMTAMPEHPAAFLWLDKAMADTTVSMMICETSVLSFLRISTNAKIFDPPLGFDEARRFTEDFLGHPSVQIFRPSISHFVDVVRLMKKNGFAGNLVMDAHLAALAISTGANLVTCDRDFKKIPYLKIFNPI